MKFKFAFITIMVAVIVGTAIYASWLKPHEWTEGEITTLRSMWIESLPELPPDPSNAYADNPQAAALGHKLFFDTRFSSNGRVACGTCHLPELVFTEGLPLGVGVGVTSRKTMTIVGTAYSPWLFWDGRKDSQWSQALGPLESPVEHGGTRMQYVHLINQFYRAEYEAIFGALPDLADKSRFPLAGGPVENEQARQAWEAMTPEDREAANKVFVNIGKAIAAYERLIMHGPARFDRYVEALLNGDKSTMKATLTNEEVAGLRLFIGKAQCIKCHNGPLFTNNSFHNTGIPILAGFPLDQGREVGAKQVLEDEFNCLSQYSDADTDDCTKLRYLVASGEESLGAFKPPTLRNVAETAPYMHAGQLTTLNEVLEHYNRAPRATMGHTELEPLHLTSKDLKHLEAFLHSLSGPLAAPPELLAPPAE